MVSEFTRLNSLTVYSPFVCLKQAALISVVKIILILEKKKFKRTEWLERT